MSSPERTSLESSDVAVNVPRVATDVPAGAIGLVLAGQHPLTLHGLSHVFAAEPDCVIRAVCADIEIIVGTVQRHRPDILILDLSRDDTFRLLRSMRRDRVAVRVVPLMGSSERDDMVKAIGLGACAVVSKELTAEELVACIRKVHQQQGEPSVYESNGARVVSTFMRRGTSRRHVIRQLTPRETQIARLAVQGVSTSEIAARLDVKLGTVKIHLHSIYTKLKVDGRLGLMLFARRHGLA